MPKSNRLAAGETKLCTSTHDEQRRWIPASAGMTSRKEKQRGESKKMIAS